MLPSSGSAAHCWKANTQETSIGWRENVALFRWLAAWEEGGLMSKNQLQRFCSTMNVLEKGKLIIWGRGQSLHYLPLCANFLLIGWWWGNRVVFQESCAQPEVTILHLGGGLSSCRRTQRYCYVYPSRSNQDYCILIAPPLFLHFPPFPVWICPLELREGQGSWMKLISYKQETGDLERICTWERLTGSCLVLLLLHFQNFFCVCCFLKIISPKMILMPKRHIVGW